MRPPRLHRIVIVALVALAAGSAYSQESVYRVVAYVGGGASLYTASAGTPAGLSTDVSKFGPAATVRLMWEPDHLLGVGLESGWTKLYSYTIAGPTSGTMYHSQVPLFVVWSMKFWDAVHLFGGYGYSRVITNLDYAGTATVATWSMGWMAACSYERPLTHTLGIAGEAKWITPVETGDGAFTLQVQLVWNVFEY
ncbi:MAG TPA: outer membrane beta-barrel protein [Bacteroidota bacterium]|nr:outer membrane beta-barrel protein [Bacteroidota bacterium]